MTVYCDVSEFNPRVDDSYPYRFIAIRSNDGTYTDAHFRDNYAWCLSALDRGRIDGFIVYAVYRPDGGQWAAQLIRNVGTPPPALMVPMADVESWGGAIRGDQSAGIGAGMALWRRWTGSQARAVGYGNQGDLAALWPARGAQSVILADYDTTAPVIPGEVARQYTSAGTAPPFGRGVDMNVELTDFYTRIGLVQGTPAGTEVEMTPEQARQLQAIYEALFGPAAGGATTPLTWKNLDGTTGSSNYGILPILIYNQVLIGQLKTALAALPTGTVDQAAMDNAAQQAITAAIAGLTVSFK